MHCDCLLGMAKESPWPSEGWEGTQQRRGALQHMLEAPACISHPQEPLRVCASLYGASPKALCTQVWPKALGQQARAILRLRASCPTITSCETYRIGNVHVWRDGCHCVCQHYMHQSTVSQEGPFKYRLSTLCKTHIVWIHAHAQGPCSAPNELCCVGKVRYTRHPLADMARCSSRIGNYKSRVRRQVSSWAKLRTHTAGERDEIGKPESHPLALQLHAIEDDAGNDYADEDGQHELLQHLVAQVGDHSVQPIITLPVPISSIEMASLTFVAVAA